MQSAGATALSAFHSPWPVKSFEKTTKILSWTALIISIVAIIPSVINAYYDYEDHRIKILPPPLPTGVATTQQKEPTRKDSVSIRKKD